MVTDRRSFFTTIIIIILAIVLTISTFRLAEELFGYRSSYKTESRSMYYAIQNNQYFQLPDEVRNNRILGVKENAEYKECYAVNDYFEAAGKYKAYLENGDLETADSYKKKMDDCISRMGDLSYAASEINKDLGITE